MAESRTCGVGGTLLTVYSELSKEELKNILGHGHRLYLAENVNNNVVQSNFFPPSGLIVFT